MLLKEEGDVPSLEGQVTDDVIWLSLMGRNMPVACETIHWIVSGDRRSHHKLAFPYGEGGPAKPVDEVL